MTKDDARHILEQVKENHKKLDSCTCHDFSVDLTPDQKMLKKYQCVNCKGEVDSIAKYWYEKGQVNTRKPQIQICKNDIGEIFAEFAVDTMMTIHISKDDIDNMIKNHLAESIANHIISHFEELPIHKSCTVDQFTGYKKHRITFNIISDDLFKKITSELDVHKEW